MPGSADIKKLIATDLNAFCERLVGRLEYMENRLNELEEIAHEAKRLIAIIESKWIAEYDEKYSIPRKWLFNPEDTAVPSENLYACEFSGSGNAYRWTGPESDTTFTFLIDRTKDKLGILDVVGVIEHQPIESIRIFIDGEEAQTNVINSSIQFRVSSRGAISYSPLTTLTVQSPEPKSAVDMETGVDKRKLGICISYLRVGED